MHVVLEFVLGNEVEVVTEPLQEVKGRFGKLPDQISDSIQSLVVAFNV